MSLVYNIKIWTASTAATK